MEETMKKSKFTEAQVAAALRECAAGTLRHRSQDDSA